MNDTELLRKFNVLCARRDEFCQSSTFILACIGIAKGVDTLIDKYRWYAQVAYEITDGDVSTITADERIEFIKLHIRLVKATENEQNNQNSTQVQRLQ